MADLPKLKAWDDFNPAVEANKKLHGVADQLSAVRTSVDALAKKPSDSGHVAAEIRALQAAIDGQSKAVQEALHANAGALIQLRQAIQQVPAAAQEVAPKKSGKIEFEVTERDAKGNVKRFVAVED